MQTIRLATWIGAPVERCFRLSLSVDLHVVAARVTGEQVTSGVRSGLLGMNDMVTWSGHYFRLKYRHTNLIDSIRPYLYFRDVMVEGTFRRFEHEHHFAALNDGTRMRDEVRFSATRGPLGELTEMLLRRYVVRLLKQRNALLRRVAESDEWQRFLISEARRRPAGAEREQRKSALYRA